MTNKQKLTLKRYAISSAVTFSTGFGLVLLSNIDNITMESFKDGTVWGVLFTATRFGVKGLLELYLSKQK